MTTPISRKAHLTKHTCGAHVIVGLDADTAALVARCEPYPLSPIGEVEAMRDGRDTYRVMWGALDRRDRWNIPGQPPAPGRPVLAAHRCGDPLPAAWLAPPSPRPRPSTADEGMPF